MAGLGAKEILRNVTALEQLIEEINFQRAKEMRQCLMSKESDTGFVMVQGTTYWTDLFVRHFLFQTDRLADADDLLFFIRKKHLKGSRYIPKYQTDVEVYRKDSRKLPIGDPDIDWEETVYLNLIIHQFDYTLTLAVCTRTSPKELQVLRRHSQKVYASPSRRRMDTKGEVEEITYPNVCFHVDNFDEVFADMLVRDGEMVCVELVAADQSGARQAVIFLGSIRYDALKRVYDARASLSSKVAQRMMLGLFASSNQRIEFVRMKGPQGKGHAEMAVTKPKGLGGAETPTSEPGVALTDMWDSDWEDEPEDRFIYRHQRRLSDPSANFNTFMNSGWKSRSEGARSRSENEGLDHFADGLYEIESGDVRDALCSGRCCGSMVGCNQDNQEFKLDDVQPEVTCHKCRHFHFMAQDMAPLSDTEEETEPEGQPLLGLKEQRDKKIDFHIEPGIPLDEQNISGEKGLRKPLEYKNEKAEDQELQPFLRVDTDADACTNIKVENENLLEIGVDEKYLVTQDWRNISKENKFVSYLDEKTLSELTLEPENCKALEIGSDPIAENLYKLETDTIEKGSNKSLSVEDTSSIQQIDNTSMTSNIVRQNNDLIDLSSSKVESSNRRPYSCHILDQQNSFIDIDSNKKVVCKRTKSLDAHNELPNVPVCDIGIKDKSALQDEAKNQNKEEFIIIDSKTIEGGNSEIIKETSFISKEIQEQIGKANSSTSLPLSLKYENKDKAANKSLSDDPIVSFSSKRIRQKQGRKPGTALRLTSKMNQKSTENDEGNDSLIKIESSPIDPSITSTSKEHNEAFKDYKRSKDYSQLVKASSCDSAESATALNNEDIDSMLSIEALSLSPTKKRKRRKISVPFIKTSDGTVIKYFCDAKLDDGAYNQLWTTKGFTQTFHFWKEHRRQTSVPLNAYLTYVTLPWFTIITDILDHRSGPILTF